MIDLTELTATMTELSVTLTGIAETDPGNENICRLAGRISEITGRLLGIGQDPGDDNLPSGELEVVWAELAARYYEQRDDV